MTIYHSVTALLSSMDKGLISLLMLQEQDMQYIIALLTDTKWGTLDAMHPNICQFPMALKTSKTKDPNIPMYHEATSSLHCKEFQEAMHQEISELEKTWHIDHGGQERSPSRCECPTKHMGLRDKVLPQWETSKVQGQFL